jgi:quercetin dioxygenase-like cupin family protein
MSKQLWLAGLFLTVASATGPSLPQMRMTPAEVRATTFDGSQVGSSAVVGVRSKLLLGDPAKAGFYTILLFVPVHTIIQAHSHRDDRMAVVVSGEWHFGYGNHFNEELLKTLPPGSVYSEPGGQTHFAQTENEPVVVEISGYGPTDTRYFDPINDPMLRSPSPDK